MHWHNKTSTVLFGLVALSLASLGCTDPGLPWGILEVDVEASFDPSPERLDDQGRLITANNYRVTVDEVTLTFDAVTVAMAPEGAAGFDPANPPEGYSLCHNGHCHNDSGALVDYEDIALELAGGGSGGSRVAVALSTDETTVGAQPTGIAVMPCDPSPCELPIGKLVAAEVLVKEIHVRGTAFDMPGLSETTIPAEGLAFDIRSPLTSPLVAEIEGQVGIGEPVGLALSAIIAVPDALLDKVPFADLGGSVDGAELDAVLLSAFEETLGKPGVLTVRTERF